MPEERIELEEEPDLRVPRARFLYPDGIVGYGPWFNCTQKQFEAISKWARVEREVLK